MKLPHINPVSTTSTKNPFSSKAFNVFSSYSSVASFANSLLDRLLSIPLQDLATLPISIS